MTPTLVGRWQTRLAMLSTLGLLVTLIFAIVFDSLTFFAVLFWVFTLGLLWDVVFILLQSMRWDRDWPAIFQIGAGVLEGAVLYGLISFWGLPGIERGSIPPSIFSAHYGLVWLVTFAWVQGPMRAFFPFWRFHGGRLSPVVTPSANVEHHRSPLRRSRRRPSRVTAVALFVLATAIFGLAYGVLLIFIPRTIISALAETDAPELIDGLSSISLPIGVVLVLLGLLYLWMAGGLLGGRVWARITAIVIGVFAVLSSVVALLLALVAPPMIGLGSMGALGTTVTLVIYGAVVIALATAGRFFR